MKDIRILLTTGNSVWGVISKVIGSNVYENIISFKDENGIYSETLKDEFVGENLFNGNLNWKELFDDESTKTKELTLINDINIEYRYKIKDTDDKMEIINKDTIILRYTKEDGTHEYLYYAINDIVNTNHEVVIFSAEKDIMFSHFDNIEWKGESAIVRAHTDRYDGTNFIKKDNYLNESELLFAEPVKKTDKKLIQEQKIQITTAEGTHDGGTYRHRIKNLIWNVVFHSIRDENDTGIIALDGNVLPFVVRIVPVGIRYERDTFDSNGDLIITEELISNNTHIYWYNLDTPSVITQISESGNLYDKFKEEPTTISIFETDLVSLDNFEVRLNGFSYLSPEIAIANELYNFDTTNSSWRAGRMSQFDKAENLSVVELDKPSLTSYTELRNINNEVKLTYSQFLKYKFTQRDIDDEVEILPEFIKDDEIRLGGLFGIQPEILSHILYVNNDELNDNLLIKKGINYAYANELPTDTVAFKEYLSQHRITSKTGYLGGAGEKIIGGAVAGAVGGSIFPGVGTAIGAGAGAIVGTGGALFNAIDHSREMRDLKKTPNTPKSTSNSYGLNFSIDGNPYIYKYELPDDYKLRAYDYLYSMGYAVRKIGNVDEWLNTRYYFNYIKTGSVFSNIGLPLSAKQKQIISDSMENGLTVWYYRDKNTFKGILNYKYENMELSLLPNLKEV